MRNNHKLTPGEMIKHFLEDMGATQHELAQSTSLPPSRITEIIKGRRGITADTALRLSKAFNNSADFWLNLQMSYELEKARASNGEKIDQEAHQLEVAG